MKEKLYANLITTIAILIMLLSVPNITMRGVREGFSTVYQSLILFDDFSASSSIFLCVLFWIMIFIFMIANLIIYKQRKKDMTISLCCNILIGTISFLLFINCNYIMMLLGIQVMVCIQIILQCSKNDKNFHMIIMVSTISIFILNSFFLVRHLSIANYFGRIGADLTENRIAELVNISRINMVCFGVFLIPCIITTINLITTNKSIK